MKNLVIVFLIGMVVLFAVSCDEGEVSKKHVYTEEELKLRDSLEAARNNVNADFLLISNIEIPLDSVAYRSVEVQVDTDLLIEKLGFASAAELTTALGTVVDGFQVDHTVDFFAINNSTRYDYTGGFTAAGHGHWFDGQGDVCNWGEIDNIYSEFNAETFTFVIGQRPKRLVKGDTHKIIQVMAKGDTRVAFVFNITVGDYYKIPVATNVATVDLTLEVEPNNDYAPTDLAFDFDAAAAAIGVSTEELSANSTFFGINADGSMTSSYTADAGYWYSQDGDVTNWGTEGCALYVNYEEGIFHIGQFPDAAQVGEEFNVSVAIMYKTTKKVTYNITVKVI
jgi:hypothetical protein